MLWALGMRCLIQRVKWARVTVDAATVGETGPGVLLLLGVGKGDSLSTAQQIARKVAELRIFTDDQDKMNRSLLDVAGGALVVSQFTLYADLKRGRRPYFGDAEAPELATQLCDAVVQSLRDVGVGQVATGIFGAHMQVELCNDGPVTIWLDSAMWQ